MGIALKSFRSVMDNRVTTVRLTSVHNYVKPFRILFHTEFCTVVRQYWIAMILVYLFELFV